MSTETNDAVTPVPPVRRGRPPKGAPQLSRQVIVDAALTVIDADGVSTFSMRTVGRRLGVDAKSLYNHVAGKEDLLDAVAERILTEIVIPEPTGSPAQDLRAIARAFRRGALGHPQAATLVLTRQLSSPAGLAPTAAVLSVLLRAGFSPPDAVHTLRSLLAALIGALLREASAGPSFGTGDAPAIARRREALLASGLPGLVEAAADLAHCDHDQEFEFTVDLLIAAVLAGRQG